MPTSASLSVTRSLAERCNTSPRLRRIATQAAAEGAMHSGRVFSRPSHSAALRGRIGGVRTKRCMCLFEERTKADISKMKAGVKSKLIKPNEAAGRGSKSSHTKKSFKLSHSLQAQRKQLGWGAKRKEKKFKNQPGGESNRCIKGNVHAVCLFQNEPQRVGGPQSGAYFINKGTVTASSSKGLDSRAFG